MQDLPKPNSRKSKRVTLVMDFIKKHIGKIILIIISAIIGTLVGYLFHLEPDFNLYSSDEMVILSKGESKNLDLIVNNCTCLKKYKNKISFNYYCPEKRIDIINSPLVVKCPDRIQLTIRHPPSQNIKLGKYYIDFIGTGPDNNIKRDRVIVVIQGGKDTVEPQVPERGEGLQAEGLILSPKFGDVIKDRVEVVVRINPQDSTDIYWIAVYTQNLYWPKGSSFTASDLVDKKYKITFNELYYAPEVEIILLKVDETVNQYFTDWTELTKRDHISPGISWIPGKAIPLAGVRVKNAY